MGARRECALKGFEGQPPFPSPGLPHFLPPPRRQAQAALSLHRGCRLHDDTPSIPSLECEDAQPNHGGDNTWLGLGNRDGRGDVVGPHSPLTGSPPEGQWGP